MHDYTSRNGALTMCWVRNRNGCSVWSISLDRRLFQLGLAHLSKSGAVDAMSEVLGKCREHYLEPCVEMRDASVEGVVIEIPVDRTRMERQKALDMLAERVVSVQQIA